MASYEMPSSLILNLYGDNQHNDRKTIGHLFLGGFAVDLRTNEMISARSIKDLPAGIYKVGEPAHRR